MSEWWTYSLRDLLLFSQRTYYRLFELYNLEWWPLHGLALALGLALLVLARQRGQRAGRTLVAILALGWLWVAWAYHGQRYASINWAADYYAWAWALQGALLLVNAAIRGRCGAAPATRLQQRVGLALLLFALLVFPLIGPLHGRSWTQAEVFGMAPDPTVLATLGVLLLAGARPAWALFPIPVAWCLISGATLWAIDSPDFWVVPVSAMMAVAVRLRVRHQSD